MDKPGNQYVVGIDPGKAKCGIAVVSLQGVSVARYVVSLADLERKTIELSGTYSLHAVVVGDKTGHKNALERLQLAFAAAGLPADMLQLVPEHLSSVEGRKRYLLDHQQSWRRFIPLGLRTPPEPFDDYTAEVLALRYINSMQ